MTRMENVFGKREVSFTKDLERAWSIRSIRALLTRYRDAAIGLGLFGIAFGLYVSTLPTSITWANFSADSGELASAVYTLGVAHPPGYPTYILLGKLFSFFPVGEVAFRTNLMSAFFGAGTIALLYFIVLDFIALAVPNSTDNRGVARFTSAGVAALALAASPLIWSQAIVTEVYTLNVFFAAAITLLLVHRAVRRAEAPTGLLADRYLLAASFLLGLGMGNHMTLVLLVPPTLLLIAAKWDRRSFLTVPGALASFLVGLSIYVYLPISASQHPLVNWGQASEASGFWWVISGTPYRELPFSASSDLWLDRLTDWWSLLVDQFYYPGVALGLIGTWWLWRRHLVGGVFTTSYVLLLIIYAGTYNTPDSFVYLIPAFMIFGLWVGLGSFWTLTEAVPWMWRKLRPVNNRRAYRISIVLVVLLILAFVPGRSLAANYGDQDLSNDSEAIEYGQRVLRAIEPGSLLIADTDNHIFSLWYTQFVVDPRPDVVLITQNLLVYDWYTESVEDRYPGVLPDAPGRTYHERLPNLILGNLDKRPIYLTDRTSSNAFVFDRFMMETVPIGEGALQQIYRVQGEKEDFS